MRIINKLGKLGKEFSILLETTNKNGIHFCLAKEVNIPRTIYIKRRWVNVSKSELKRQEGCYFLLWGPETDTSKNMDLHGISEFKTIKNHKMSLSKTTREFFNAVKNSETQSFVFDKRKTNIKI